MGFGWRPPTEGADMAKKTSDTKDMDKLYLMSNGDGTATRMISQRQWNEQGKDLIGQGYIRPQEIEDSK